MARGFALLCIISLLAVSAAPALARYTAAKGKRDVGNIIKCLKKRGDVNTFLKLLQASGFEQILARYVVSQQVTLLVPTDKAFASLSLRVRNNIKGAQAIKLLEYHMMLQWLPADYIRLCQPTAFFDSVLGDYIFKQKAANPSTIILAASRNPSPSQLARVVKADACALQVPTVAVQVINNVLIPANMWATQTH